MARMSPEDKLAAVQRYVDGKDVDLKADIQAIYDEHEGRYGYRRIRDELANRGQKGLMPFLDEVMKLKGLITIHKLNHKQHLLFSECYSI